VPKNTFEVRGFRPEAVWRKDPKRHTAPGGVRLRLKADGEVLSADEPCGWRRRQENLSKGTALDHGSRMSNVTDVSLRSGLVRCDETSPFTLA
jgi:hypothetical protein